MRTAAIVITLLLASCKEPVPGECLGQPGSLCITVRNAESFPPGLRAALEVRLGGCEAVPPFACQAGAAVASVPGCRMSCQDVPVPDRFTSAEGRFTVEVDLAGSTGPGQAGVRLHAPDDANGCLGEAVQTWDGAPPAALALDPHAAACTVRPRRCRSHLDCGGAEAAQVCEAGVCVDPPADICPDDMVFIPAGAFILGDVAGLPREQPCTRDGIPVRHRITRPFCIDRTEATVASYRACAACDKPPERMGCTYSAAGPGDLAMNCISHAQAAAFCAARTFRGQAARLPSEAEWEWAAGRDPKRRYPWDNTTPADICQHANGSGCEASMLKVRQPGMTPRGNTPSAPAVPWPARPLVDLAGNLAEWVADATPMGLHSYCDLPLDDPLNLVGNRRIVRGGSYADQPPTLQTFARNEYDPTPDAGLIQRVGIRCVLTPPLPTP